MDIQKVATDGLRSACKIFLLDLQALPEEAFCQRFSEATRTVADIVYEVNLVNDHVGMVIRGEEPFEWPEERFLTAPSDFCTKDTIVGAFEKSSERIVATLENFSSAQFEEPIQTDRGETTRFERSGFMTLHLWYHSGQLNFIQTLIGDNAWHWT